MDFKKNLFDNSHIKYEQSNLSIPSIFNLSSIYLLNPLFDNGCCIYSNMVPLENGFEKYNLENRGEFKHKLFNNGINWCFFQSKNKKSGISIINLSIIIKSAIILNILSYSKFAFLAYCSKH